MPRLGFTFRSGIRDRNGLLAVAQERVLCEALSRKIVGEEGLSVLGWRDTRYSNSIGRLAAAPAYIEQIFIGERREWTGRARA